MALHSLFKNSMDSSIIRILSLHDTICIANGYKPLHCADCVTLDRSSVMGFTCCSCFATRAYRSGADERVYSPLYMAGTKRLPSVSSSHLGPAVIQTMCCNSIYCWRCEAETAHSRQAANDQQCSGFVYLQCDRLRSQLQLHLHTAMSPGC